MKTVKIIVEEEIRYRDEIIVEVPDAISEDELKNIISITEKECFDCSSKDVAYLLNNRHGFNIVSKTDNFPDSSDSSKLEIVGFFKIEENTTSKR